MTAQPNKISFLVTGVLEELWKSTLKCLWLCESGLSLRSLNFMTPSLCSWTSTSCIMYLNQVRLDGVNSTKLGDALITLILIRISTLRTFILTAGSRWAAFNQWQGRFLTVNSTYVSSYFVSSDSFTLIKSASVLLREAAVTPQQWLFGFKDIPTSLVLRVELS